VAWRFSFRLEGVRRVRPTSYVGEEAVERFGRVVDRRPVDADQDVEHLRDGDDGDATVSSVQRRGDRRGRGVAEQDADDGSRVDDYSP